MFLSQTLSGAVSSTSAVTAELQPNISETHQAPSLFIPGPLLSACWSGFFVMCSALLALVGPSPMAFWLIEHVELAMEPVGVRDHYD